MTQNAPLQLSDFMPYLLNRAAEVTSLEFQRCYKEKFGMLRSEWRVVFHLGRYGDLTAKQICTMSGIHKTKVSRAVSALQDKRFLARNEVPSDRRQETLSLTKQGQATFEELQSEALDYNKKLMAHFTPEDYEILQRCLKEIANIS